MAASSGSEGRPSRRRRQASRYRLRKAPRSSPPNSMGNLRLVGEFAPATDHAFGATRLARETDVAAVQDQPMVSIAQERRRRDLQQLLFHGQGRRSGGQTGP